MTVVLRLLDRFDVEDAVIGDLLEQRASRSAAWLVWQLVVAILQTIVADLRRNKTRAIAVAVVSSIAAVVWAESTLWAYLWLSEKWFNAWTSTTTTWSARALFVWWQLYGGGLSLVWCVGSAAIGSFTARLHHERGATMVVMAALAQLPAAVWWGVPILVQAVRNQVFWVNFVVVGAVILVGMPLAALVVGLTYGRTRSSARPHPSSWTSESFRPSTPDTSRRQ